MITLEELDKASPYLYDKEKAKLPVQYLDNSELFFKKINEFRKECGIPMLPTSYYRPVEYEKQKGRSGNSEHTRGTACDFADADRRLTNYILVNPGILEKYNFYMEDPDYTKTWVHLGLEKKSKRIYKPY